jgi:hypothetical protein
MRARLTEEELRDVLARAEEIQRAADTDAELQAVVRAAEELGLQREAVERAIQERFGHPAEPPKSGDLVFAQSNNERFYAAEVVESGHDRVRVRFLNGSEHTVPPSAIKPLNLLPGDRIVCQWPWWGAWTSTVVSYNSAKRRVRVDDGWGGAETFPLSEIWLNPPKSKKAGGRARVYLFLVGISFALGGIVGTALTLLLSR